ncbi:hypothetical protein G647_10112 [Cladophialophora carrionii CBS 160.54]|uniref:Uncharacterized protein n=1 Tax=Cladophialophora carrionii CBS 160.54 TaxID=1279043 RepID=V9DL08_9EURO|nr:uncharacterized protein G647_10112 [Cladophialophora carrionii CBS 160.54]ETI27013.1 hypothetical protein G647_10112 [Cladophialophora carrionii CBS 160.54]
MSVLLEMYHAIQACIGMVAALLSAMAIYNLNQWEPQAETASRYSNMASQQLHKTRTTQASGALATLLSLVSSVICVVAVSSGANTTPFLLSAANSGGLFLAYSHIGNFWREKGKVPFSRTYNDGVRSSQQLLQVLGVLGVSWATATAIYLFRAIAY